jgi:hypothetical protein
MSIFSSNNKKIVLGMAEWPTEQIKDEQAHERKHWGLLTDNFSIHAVVYWVTYSGLQTSLLLKWIHRDIT